MVKIIILKRRWPVWPVWPDLPGNAWGHYLCDRMGSRGGTSREEDAHTHVGAHTHHRYAHSVLIHAHTETHTSAWTHICTHANTCSGYTWTHK